MDKHKITLKCCDAAGQEDAGTIRSLASLLYRELDWYLGSGKIETDQDTMYLVETLYNLLDQFVDETELIPAVIESK